MADVINFDNLESDVNQQIKLKFKPEQIDKYLADRGYTRQKYQEEVTKKYSSGGINIPSAYTKPEDPKVSAARSILDDYKRKQDEIAKNRQATHDMLYPKNEKTPLQAMLTSIIPEKAIDKNVEDIGQHIATTDKESIPVKLMGGRGSMLPYLANQLGGEATKIAATPATYIPFEKVLGPVMGVGSKLINKIPIVGSDNIAKDFLIKYGGKALAPIKDLVPRASESVMAQIKASAEAARNEVTEATKSVSDLVTKSANLIKAIGPKSKLSPEEKIFLKKLSKREIPEITTGDIDWRPTIKYSQDNWYTENAYKLIDVLEQKKNAMFDKLPHGLDPRTFANNEIKKLSLETSRVQNGLLKKVKEDFIDKASKMNLRDRNTLGLAMRGEMQLPKSFDPVMKKAWEEFQLDIGAIGLKQGQLFDQWEKEGMINSYDKLFSEKQFLKDPKGYSKKFYARTADELEKRSGGIKPYPSKNAGAALNQSDYKPRMSNEDWGRYTLEREGGSTKSLSKKEIEAIGREAMFRYGLVTEADAIGAMTIKNMTNNYTKMLYQDYVFHNPDLFSKVAKKGFERLENDGRMFGPLAGGYVHPSIADEIKFMHEDKKVGQRIFGEFLQWWKGGKVAGNIATNIRNFTTTATLQTDMAGYPIWGIENGPRYAKALKEYVTKGPQYKFWRDKGLIGNNYFDVEINAANFDRMVGDKLFKADNPLHEYSSTLSGMQEAGASPITKSEKNYGKVLSGALDVSAKARNKLIGWYGSIDNAQKIYLAESALKDGATVPQAIQFANKWRLNYKFVPKPIQAMRKSLTATAMVPFTSYETLILPRIAEVALTRPWVLAKYPMIFEGITSANRYRMGMGRDEMQLKAPEFLDVDKTDPRKLKWYQTSNPNPYVILTGGTKQHPEFTDLRGIFPIGDASTGFVNPEHIVNVFGSGGITGAGMALGANYDPYRGGPVVRPDVIRSRQAQEKRDWLIKTLLPGDVSETRDIVDVARRKITGQPLETTSHPEPMQKGFEGPVTHMLAIPKYHGGPDTVIRKLDEDKKSIKTDALKKKNLVLDYMHNTITFPQLQKDLMEWKQELMDDEIIRKRWFGLNNNQYDSEEYKKVLDKQKEIEDTLQESIKSVDDFMKKTIDEKKLKEMIKK